MDAPQVTTPPEDTASPRRSAEDLIAMQEGCPCARCEALRNRAPSVNGVPPEPPPASQEASSEGGPSAEDLDILADAAGRVDGRIDRMDHVERLAARVEALVHEVEVTMRRVRALERERYDAAITPAARRAADSAP